VVTSIYLTDSIIFAATHSHGLWKLTNPFKFDLVDCQKSPDFSIYPNPFCNEIKIDLSELSQFKSASLFNVAGVLVVKTNDPVIQTANLKSGVYILKVELESGSCFRKMIKD
jgi:hypothetical protein